MNKLPQVLIISGSILIILAIILFVYIFAPVAKVEIEYTLKKPEINKEIMPVDKEFGIVIPKIGANSKIVPQVDPYDANIYQNALAKGVAQAKGTVFPDSIGNMFLFSHSSVNLLEATRYNSIFYLLSKLNKGDEIYTYYKGVKYKYKVNEIKVVDAKEVSYLSPHSSTKTLTLMTCWPAGTNFKRLIVTSTQE